MVGVASCFACASSGGDHPTTPIRSSVVPRPPLKVAACVAEMHSWGWAAGAARVRCAGGGSAPWFHATFTNTSGRDTYIRCAFTAWDSNGRQLFWGDLPLAVVGFPAGVYLERHKTRSMDWFFDALDYPQALRHARDVARYTSACTPWSNPPV